MPKSVKLTFLATSVVLVLAIFLTVNVHANPQQEGAYHQIGVYQEVLQHVQDDYVTEPNIPAVTNGALRGLLESLDADSSYLTPEDYKAYKKAQIGKAQVGINVSKRFGYATIISVVPGSPADKADLNDGDIIEAIGNQDTRDLSLAMIQLLLQGTPGSELQLAVIRPRKADPDKLTLNRVVVSEPPVAEQMYENSSILYVKPETLDKEHVSELETRLKGMNKAGNKKILLDLRDVAAGDMSEAVRAANLFLKSGTIATLEGQKFPLQTFAADPNKAVNATAPLVVLVNRGTSGPGELLAAALGDSKRADLVGEKTFGEGTQQKTFEMADGGAVILSVAKYAGPSGKKFVDDAVTPTTLVASNLDNLVSEDDSTPGPTGKPAAIAKKPAAPPDDQLSKALEMLKAKQA